MLYTSGSTGKPKGVQHSSGGYLLQAVLSMKYTFDIKPNDVYWCTADIGWVTGHTYITYGPLACGATEIVFEGVPTYPDAGRFWKTIQAHKVSIFYTAPTAIRSLIKAGETTHFAQPSVSSAVLNRVLSDPSAIYGTLSSNGRIWLINPAGIMVGAGGRIDTAGFVASTLNIRNEDFLAGRKLFENPPGAANGINQGEILSIKTRTINEGTFIISGSIDHTIKVWSFDKHVGITVIQTLIGHEGAVRPPLIRYST